MPNNVTSRLSKRLQAVDVAFLEAMQKAFDCAVSAIPRLALWPLSGTCEQTIDDRHEFSTSHKWTGVSTFVYWALPG